MRPQKIDDQTLLTGLKEVLTAKGYDGASLNELADSSGLKKASLYHRFPGGKKDIGLAVLSFVGNWINLNIITVLSDSSILPEERLFKALDKIKELYNNGKSTCLLRALSMDSGLYLFGEELNTATQEWIMAFTQLGIDFGISDDLASKKALKTFSSIQGSLVTSRLLNDSTVFISALKEIENGYIKA